MFLRQVRSHGKRRSLQGLLESTKKNGVAMHFFLRWLALNINKNAGIGIFSEKRGKGCIFTDFLRIRLYMQTANMFKKTFKLHGRHFFDNKIVAQLDFSIIFGR